MTLQPEITPTEEQEEISRAAAGESASLMIEAMAGCAKTTSLELLGRRIRGPALALAFNKAIAEELKGRFAGNFETKTMNGLGFGALRRALPSVSKWELDDRKVGRILTEEAKRSGVELRSEEWDEIRRLVSAGQNAGLLPGSAASPNYEGWQAVADAQWMDGGEMEFALADAVLRSNNELTRKGTISFDDQVYWPTVFEEGKFPQYPTILVDEAQDLSPLQHSMLAKATGARTRMMVCGDPRQAIYAFRGADAESMGKIRGLRESWLDRPLTLTFRCPKVIVKRQQRHAPGFRAWPGNPEGEAIRLMGEEGEAGWRWNWADIEELRPHPSASLAVICRNNAPLFKLAFRLLRQGVGVVMLGRDIGKGLKALVKKVGGKSVEDFFGRLREWRDKQLELARLNSSSEGGDIMVSVKADSIHDKYECIIAIAEGAMPSDLEGLVRAIDSCFERERATVTLASIHKAKGLEWDTVLHLDPWRIPSKQALRAAERGNAAGLVQEWNLKYVCETRSKHTLIEANVKEMEYAA